MHRVVALVEFAVVDVDCFVTYSESEDSFGHTYISMLRQLVAGGFEVQLELC